MTAVLLVAGALVAHPAVSAAAGTCRFTASTGDVELDGTGRFQIERAGDELRIVELVVGPAGFVGEIPVPCANTEPPGGGATPTVDDTERVTIAASGYFEINTFGGPFAPGASPEPGAAEIEFELLPGAADEGITLIGGGTGGQIELGDIAAGGSPGINVNAELEGGPGESDTDIALDPGRTAVTTVWGTEGPDRITGAGEGHFERPFPLPVHFDGFGGDDVMIAGDGPASMLGFEGADRLVGGPAADQLGACGPGDELRGNGGDDRLGSGGAGVIVDGGAGTDLATFGCISASLVGAPAQDGITVDLGLAAQQEIGHGASVTLSAVENLDGTHGHDVLRGDAGPNLIYGGTGGDRIRSLGGDDEVQAGSGGDRLWGGGGADELVGSRGKDRLSARDGTRDRLLDCGAGNDRRERAIRDRIDPRPKSC